MAGLTVPSDRVPDIAPSGPRAVEFRPGVNPAAFGMPVARGLEQAGAEIGKGASAIDEQVLRSAQLANEALADDAYSNHYSERVRAATTGPGGLYTKLGKDAIDATPGTVKSIRDAREEIATGLPNEAARRMFNYMSRRRAEYEVSRAETYFDQQNKVYQKGMKLARIVDNQVQGADAWNDSQRFGELVEGTRNLARVLGSDEGQSPEQIAGTERHFVGQMWEARLKAMSRTDPGSALKLLEANRSQMEPAHQAAIQNMLLDQQRVQEQRALTAEMRSEAAARRADTKVTEHVAGKIIDTIIQKGPGAIDPAQDIAGDNGLKPSTKEALFGFWQRQTTRDAKGDRDETTYGKAYWSTFSAIHPTDGSAPTITTPEQIFALGGKEDGLTAAGVEKLFKELPRSTDKPEQIANRAMEKGALAYARAQITREFQVGDFKMTSPEGEANFNTKFLPAFYAALNKGLAAGKTYEQMLSRDDNPNNIIDPLVKTFRVSDAAALKQRLDAGLTDKPDAKGKPAEPPPDVSTFDKLKAAVAAGKISRAEAEKIAGPNGWIKVPDANTAPQVPLAR